MDSEKNVRAIKNITLTDATLVENVIIELWITAVPQEDKCIVKIVIGKKGQSTTKRVEFLELIAPTVIPKDATIPIGGLMREQNCSFLEALEKGLEDIFLGIAKLDISVDYQSGPEVGYVPYLDFILEIGNSVHSKTLLASEFAELITVQELKA